jgi:hypothetical protein
MSDGACEHCGSRAAPVDGRCPDCGGARDAPAQAPFIPQPVAAVLVIAVLVGLVVVGVTGHIAVAGAGLLLVLLLVLALFGGGLW